jgi:uncharacterized protein YbjT (DUF2867 family)
MSTATEARPVLVLGATGFVGKELIRALVARGVRVRAASRRPEAFANADANADGRDGIEWMRCDVSSRDDVARAVEGVQAVYFLVHGMGGGAHDYAEEERKSALNVRFCAEHAGVERLVYLGGVAPMHVPSVHLRSRLDVGEVLRAGKVPTLELRASMIIGSGSASWQIVRDLAMRLPAMLLPAWTRSRTRPIAIEDVVVALVRALDVPLNESAWYDIPGPDTVSGRDILLRIAALRGRRVPSLAVPLLTVSLSSWWLKLVTRADFSLARELVLGFKEDLLPRDERYWALIGYSPRWTFDAAARRALAAEPFELSVRGMAGMLEEAVVQIVSPKLDS